MKSLKPTITGIVPTPPIVIHVPDGQVFGESGSEQLQVQLSLTGELPATAIASLEILSPHLYRFADGASKRQYIIPMTAHQMTALLEFKIKNLAFFPNTQPTFDIGVFTWEQSTGESIKDSDFAHIAVKVARTVKLMFKKLLK